MMPEGMPASQESYSENSWGGGEQQIKSDHIHLHAFLPTLGLTSLHPSGIITSFNTCLYEGSPSPHSQTSKQWHHNQINITFYELMLMNNVKPPPRPDRGPCYGSHQALE